MTEAELDELLTFRWPMVLRRVMVDGSDDWLKGFCKSIARHGKRPGWRPSRAQEQIMRRLLAEIGHSGGDSTLIETERERATPRA